MIEPGKIVKYHGHCYSESKREYYPKQVAMSTEMVGMQVSLNTDTGRAQ